MLAPRILTDDRDIARRIGLRGVQIYGATTANTAVVRQLIEYEAYEKDGSVCRQTAATRAGGRRRSLDSLVQSRARAWDLED